MVERIQLIIDGQPVSAEPGKRILDAARDAGIYLPSLCAHPDLPPQKGTPPALAVYHGTRRIEHDPGAEGPGGCGLCVVEVEGRAEAPACATEVEAGMVVTTTAAALGSLRRERLARILATHPHACLTCAQQEGCTREPCSMNVPVEERCCALLGRCELQAVAEYVGIDPGTPRYLPSGEPPLSNEPLFDREPDLCIACGRCVRACNLREVGALGWVRDSTGRRWVGTLAPTLAESGCRFCGSCIEVCPTGALRDRGIRHAEREDALVPCRSACPAGTDVPRYVRLVSEGRFEEAAAVVAERAPLVETLGQICSHPCEDACRRNDLNQAPLSICRIKREAGAASATKWADLLPEPLPDTGKKVVVVGAGPAGLVAAFRLRLLGHRVTVLEREPKIGGMLTYGIPPFRLSREVVVRETEILLRGVEVKTAVEVGNGGMSLLRLQADHHAVLLAVGASRSLQLGVAGENLGKVLPGLPFLRDVTDGGYDATSLEGETVLVVGGGNVALDCARSAVRLGALSVDLVCLEKPDEMPAYAEEVEAALAEGIHFSHGWGIRAFRGDGSLRSVELKRCTRVFDPDDTFSPTYDEADTRSVAASTAIVAIGQRAPSMFSRHHDDGVFAAGDLATGPRSVVEAVASGRQVAAAIDRYLGGSGELALTLGPVDAPIALGRTEGFVERKRLQPEPLTYLGLSLIPPGLGRDLARKEADRCLRCDLRLQLTSPERPPARKTRLAMTEASLDTVPDDEGVVRFYGADDVLLEIVGGPDMRQEVAARLDTEKAKSFDFQPSPMYTQLQNELLSQYTEVHGGMPPGVRDEDDLDDLF